MQRWLKRISNKFEEFKKFKNDLNNNKINLKGGGKDIKPEENYFNNDTILQKNNGKGIIKSLSNKKVFKIFDLSRNFSKDYKE